MENLEILAKGQELWLIVFKEKLTPTIHNYFVSMYRDAETLGKKQNLHSQQKFVFIVSKFQAYCDHVKDWSMIELGNQIQKHKRVYINLKNLIKANLKLHLQILIATRVGNVPSITLPPVKTEVFIHTVYKKVAQFAKNYPYYFTGDDNPLKEQENHHEMNQIIKSILQTTLLEFLPIDKLNEDYEYEIIRKMEEITQQPSIIKGTVTRPSFIPTQTAKKSVIKEESMKKGSSYDEVKKAFENVVPNKVDLELEDTTEDIDKEIKKVEEKLKTMDEEAQ